MDCKVERVHALLPELKQVDTLVLEQGDVFVHAPGFEDRTLAFVDIVGAKGGASAVLLEYEPNNPENRISQVRDELEKIGFPVNSHSIVTYNRFCPLNFGAALESLLQSVCSGRVIVDISTMSKLAIMLILWVVRKLKLPVVILYNEARLYGPSEDQFNDAKVANMVHQPSLQIFSGIHGVVRVDSLASVAMHGQPTAAVVFMSFNDALTQTLLNTVYPTRLFLVNGRPPVYSWREEATAWIHENVRKEWGEDNPLKPDGSGLPARSVSTLDYRETVTLLTNLYWRLSGNHRILLAPAGSKLQAVGCSLMKALHPDIHIEYPSPQGFLEAYSEGIGRTWLLDFGDVDGLISQLGEVERREFLEIH